MTAGSSLPLDPLSTVAASDETDCTRANSGATRTERLAADSPAGESAFPDFGRFRNAQPIGGGAMGRVYQVFDPQTGQFLALKTWQKQDPRLQKGLKEEFRALANLRHPNLIRLYEFYADEQCPFFTMELVTGENLLAWVRPPAGAGQAGFDEQRLRDALRQLAEGLDFLHRNKLVHRDIKPSNILVTHAGELKLLDFGVAVPLNQQGVYEPTVFGSTAGTDKYMSPLQALGGKLTAADDWYSVGLVLFECLTGQSPFPPSSSLALHDAKRKATRGVSPKTLQPLVPDDLDALCTALTVVDPDSRPKGEAILDQLGAAAVPAAAVARSLLGREHEMDSLREALADVLQRRQPRMVLVQGSSGVGKSELVSRFLEEAGRRGDVRIFRGRCYENVFVPYQAFEELLTDVCRHLRKLPDLARQAVLPTDIRSLCLAFPVFSDHGVVPSLPGPGPHSTAQELRQQGFAALRELLHRIGPVSAIQGPLPLLFVDDLQWGDLDSLALLVELMRGPAAPACLFVGALRSEDRQTSPFLQSLCDAAAVHSSISPQFIDVQPLTQEHAAELAAELLAGEPAAPAELLRLIARQSRGNPLFVSELVQYWKRTQGDARLSGELSLDALVRQRVAGLAEGHRRLVQLVALAGRPVPPHELFRAAGLPNQNPAWVQDLRDGHFLRSVGTAERMRLDTFHDRVREAVLASLDGAARRELHERWVQVVAPDNMSAEGPTDETPIASGLSLEYEFVAQQLLGAGRTAQAARFLRLEAAQAAASFAFERATALYRLALAHHSGASEEARDMRTALAECLANIGHSAEAAGEYLAAARDAPDEAALDLRRRAAQRYLTSGHVPEGLAVLRQVLSTVGLRLPATPLGSLASLLYWRGRLWLRGLGFSSRAAASIPPREQRRLDACWSAVVGLSLVDPIRAADYVARNLWLALETGDPPRIARALAAYSGHAAINGPSAQASVEKHLAATRRAAELAGGDYGWGAVALAEGIAAHLQGHWSAAIAGCDRAESLFRRCGVHDVTWELDTAQTFAMWALMYRGDVAEMTCRQPRLASLAIERNDRYARLNFGTVVMVMVSLAADEVQTAREQLTADEALLPKGEYYVQHHNALLGRTMLELYDGRADAAWRTIENGWKHYTRSHLHRIQQVRTDFFQVFGRAAVGALAGDGKSPALRKAIEVTIGRLRREITPWAVAMADVIEAGALHCGDRSPQAVATLKSAALKLEAAEMHLFAAAAHHHLGRLQGAGDAAQQAETALRQAGVRNPTRMAAALVPGFGGG